MSNYCYDKFEDLSDEEAKSIALGWGIPSWKGRQHLNLLWNDFIFPFTKHKGRNIMFNKHRMQVLYNFLLTAPLTGRFDLRSWAGNDDIPWEGNPNLSCGTSACAVGWATTIPEFRDAGLHLTSGWGEAGLHLTDAGLEYNCPEDGITYPAFTGVEKFFGINFDTAMWAFSNDAYDGEATPQDVAERLQYLLDNNGVAPFDGSTDDEEYDEEEGDDRGEEVSDDDERLS